MLKYQLPICIVRFDYSPLMILQDLLVESCNSNLLTYDFHLTLYLLSTWLIGWLQIAFVKGFPQQEKHESL